MLKTEDILLFCEKTAFFTSKPKHNCIIDALKLNKSFGLFIKESMVKSYKFESFDDFIVRYRKFSEYGPS